MRTSSITPSESWPIGALLPMYQLATRAAIDARKPPTVACSPGEEPLKSNPPTRRFLLGFLVKSETLFQNLNHRQDTREYSSKTPGGARTLLVCPPARCLFTDHVYLKRRASAETAQRMPTAGRVIRHPSHSPLYYRIPTLHTVLQQKSYRVPIQYFVSFDVTQLSAASCASTRNIPRPCVILNRERQQPRCRVPHYCA